MLKVALLSLLILGAPEEPDAKKALKLAYASLYEWNEDGVKNVTLDFSYIYLRKPPGQGNEPERFDGRGQLVVVGNETKRRHMEGGSPEARRRVREELDWIVGRYVRKPFDERFKEFALKGPETTADGALRIRAGEIAFLLKKNRIIAVERNVGTKKRPIIVRAEYRLAELGDGYGAIGEQFSYKRGSRKYRTTRRLDLLPDVDVPMPKAHSLTTDTDRGKVTLTIKFDAPRRDSDAPVVIDEGARDALKLGWESRYTLHDKTRIESQFQRKLDRDLTRQGWTELVRGQLQVWGLDQIELELDEKLLRRRDAGRRRRIQEICLEHIRRMFERLRGRPFEQEFENCGFETGEGPGGEPVVRVLGHDKYLAFRITNDRITGHLDNFVDRDWWTYRIKATRNERVLLQQMTRLFEDRKYTLKFAYSLVKGVFVPKKFNSMVTPENSDYPVYGILEFSLKRPKVDVPKD